MQNNETKNRFSAPIFWDASLLKNNPIFALLCSKFGIDAQYAWPGVDFLNSLSRQLPVRFVDNDELMSDGRYYEEFIFHTHKVPTRSENWHDFFGALIWCLFPKTKALLNKLHISEINEFGLKERSKLRNKLTLFDECGVIIAIEPKAKVHADLLRNHLWQDSFVLKRDDWHQGITPMVFGHAIYEMATAPFIGLTAKAFFVDVPEGFHQLSNTDAYNLVDELLVKMIATEDAVLDNQQLTPLPLLGVPHWYAENEQADFYNNADYFRPKRMK